MMSDPTNLKNLSFGGPATYQIIVQGSLSPEWSDCLSGMSLTEGTGAHGEVQTTLKGTILDQVALNGILETLYGLHLSIIRVEQIEDQD